MFAGLGLQSAYDPARRGPLEYRHAMSKRTVEPRILLIETSGRAGHVAIARGSELIDVRRLDEARRHARDLAPAVAELLKGCDWKPRDVDAVFVSRGPGSYTGLRVGIMSAKAFAYAAQTKLVGVETFEAIADQAPLEVATVDVLADAQQEKVYTQRFARAAPDAVMTPATELVIQLYVDWAATHQASESWAMGPGLRVHSHADEMRMVDSASWDPQPVSLLRVGLRRLLDSESGNPFTLEPIYLRPSAAEEKWKNHPAK
jgi:tRNA threonylcarbamoyladenosine biosynthesis protein TsaB